MRSPQVALRAFTPMVFVPATKTSSVFFETTQAFFGKSPRGRLTRSRCNAQRASSEAFMQSTGLFSWRSNPSQGGKASFGPLVYIPPNQNLRTAEPLRTGIYNHRRCFRNETASMVIQINRATSSSALRGRGAGAFSRRPTAMTDMICSFSGMSSSRRMASASRMPMISVS